MKLSFAQAFGFFFLLFALHSCDQKSSSSQFDQGYLQKLKAYSIGETGFQISLPADYKLRQTQGPDFEVYYFYLNDSTAKPEMGGGMYFGNHPSLIPDGKNCELDSLQSPLLGKECTWSVGYCDSLSHAQTIAPTQKAAWMEFVHAFGSAQSDEGIQQLMAIFSTFEEIPKP